MYKDYTKIKFDLYCHFAISINFTNVQLHLCPIAQYANAIFDECIRLISFLLSAFCKCSRSYFTCKSMRHVGATSLIIGNSYSTLCIKSTK